MGANIGFGFQDQSSSTTSSGTSTTTAQQTEQQQRIQAQAGQTTTQQQQQQQQRQQQTGAQTSTATTQLLDEGSLAALRNIITNQTNNIPVDALTKSVAGQTLDIASLMKTQASGIGERVNSLSDQLASAARSQFETSGLADITRVGQNVGSQDNSFYLGTLANARAALEGTISELKGNLGVQGIGMETQALGQAFQAGTGAIGITEALASGNPQAIQTALSAINTMKGATQTQQIDVKTLQDLFGTTAATSSSNTQALQALVDLLTGQKNLTSTTVSQSKSDTDTSGFNFGLGLGTGS